MITLEQIKTLINGLKQTIPPFVKPDLSENDESSPHYVKGRTHWTDAKGRVHRLPSKYLPLAMPSGYRSEVQSLVNSGVSSANAYSDSQNKNLKADWNNKNGNVKFVNRPFGELDNTSLTSVVNDRSYDCAKDFRLLANFLTGSYIFNANITFEVSLRYTLNGGSYNGQTVKVSLPSGSRLFTKNGLNGCIKGGFSFGPYIYEGALLVLVTEPGYLEFYASGSDEVGFAGYFTARGLYGLYRDIPDDAVDVLEPGSKIYVYSVQNVYAFGQYIDPFYLPVRVLPCRVNKVYDSMEVGTYSVVPLSRSEWVRNKVYVDHACPWYLLFDEDLLVKVTKFWPFSEGTLPEDSSVNVTYRIDFSGGSMQMIDGTAYYKYIEGSMVSTQNLDEIDGVKDVSRLYLNVRKLVPVNVPACSAEDEGKILKVVNGVPAWVAESE